MKKLTDEELSLVLSQHAAGKLQHWTFRLGECGCVGGTVENVRNYGDPESTVIEPVPPRAIAISDSLFLAGCGLDYPDKPEALLALLAKAGL